MERREDKRYIAVVRDKVSGSYAFRGVATEKKVLKSVEVLKKRGIRERDIDILPVKETPKLDKILMVAGIVCTFIDLGLTIRREWLKRKKKGDKRV